MGTKGQVKDVRESNTLSFSYMIWLLTHLHLFFRKHPLASMANNSMVEILVVADGQQGKVELSETRIDRVLTKSVISKQKADQAHGVTIPAVQPVHLCDSRRRTYRPHSYITLRWHVKGGAQTTEGKFYIVDNCPYDAMLGLDMVPPEEAEEAPGGKSTFYPFQLLTETPDQKRNREAREEEEKKKNDALIRAERDEMEKKLRAPKGQK